LTNNYLNAFIVVKEAYRILCEEEAIPLFLQAWWMDAVCIRGAWDVLLYEKNGEIIAAMPFHIRKKFGLRFIIEPQLTQYSGILIKYPVNSSLRNQYELEKQICTYFIEQLEKSGFIFYQQTFHSSFTNWLPFYWKGFRQTTRYSFVIADISHPENVFAAFNERKKRDIRKAESTLKISSDLDPREFYDFHQKMLVRRKENIAYSWELFQRLTEAVFAHNQGLILSANDSQGRLYATLLVVWNKTSAYCLVYAIDDQYKQSGALSLLIWEAIKYLSDKTMTFDLEGSIIETVADSYSQFATYMKPYLEITRSNSILVDLLLKMKR
jgi:hypothetical protein